jgi:hypothetical protein
MTCPGPRPSVGLGRRAAGRLLQFLPQQLQTLESVRHVKRDGAKARLHHERAAWLDLGFGQFGFSAEEGSRTYDKTFPRRVSRRSKCPSSAIVSQGTLATMLVSAENHGRGGLTLDG